MTEQDYSLEAIHRYAIINSGNNFASRVVVAGRDVDIIGAKGLVVAKGPVAEAIDALLSQEGHSFGRMLRKIDMEMAEAQAAEFLARRRDVAAKGAFSTESFTKIRAEIAGASGAMLADAAPNNPAALAALKRDLLGADMELTELVDVNAQDTGASAPTPEAPTPTLAGGIQLGSGVAQIKAK